MASHNGLKYVLETKNGYVMEDGSFTDKVEDALLIDFWQFGFGPEAKEVYQRLGFKDSEILDSGVSFHTVMTSYEGRETSGLRYYEMMGYSYSEAMSASIRDYHHFCLKNDNNYIEYINQLKMEVLNYLKRKDCEIVNNVALYNLNKDMEVEGGELCYYYSEMGDIYRYTIPLKNPHVEKYFDLDQDQIDYYNSYQQTGLLEYLDEKFANEKFSWGLGFNTKILDMKIENDQLIMYLDDWNNWNGNKVARCLNSRIRDFYASKEMHITRMFGSYILLVRDGDTLEAKEATSIPIKYCPLMIKLLREVGGNTADKLLHTLEVDDQELQQKMMCNLINEVVIKGGYFDTNRPLNSCEANVLFGASETLSSAFLSNIIDAAVIVSNNLGTIITTSAPTTQGAVKRMTGLFYTSPDENIMSTASDEGIIPVFPYSAQIDQLAGVKKAIELGYKKIAVSVAADNNYLHEELQKLADANQVQIYKFGLCSTGISKHTAEVMREYADVVWSCASKYVKEEIEPNAICQVGLKIPVHVMTKDGFNIISNHLQVLDNTLDVDSIDLEKGDDKSIIVNGERGFKVIKKKQINGCIDCPHPCI